MIAALGAGPCPSMKADSVVSHTLAALVRFQHPLAGGRVFGQHGRRARGTPHQLAAAVGAAAAGQAGGGAVGAEGALEGADQGVRRVRRQVLVAALAIGSELEHLSVLAVRSRVADPNMVS